MEDGTFEDRETGGVDYVEGDMLTIEIPSLEAKV